jgi:hypothetical protein
MALQLPAKPGFAAANHYAARVFLALLLVVGMFGISRSTPGTSRSEPVSEGQHNEAESTKETGVQALAKRRSRFEGGGSEQMVASSGAPRSMLAPRGVELPRPSWERPRRSLPRGGDDGDDDDELG